MANFLVDLEELGDLIRRIESMRYQLSRMVEDLHDSQRVLERTWGGVKTPHHVRAEMEHIAESISENTYELDRLSRRLREIYTAYEETDAGINNAFR